MKIMFRSKFLFTALSAVLLFFISCTKNSVTRNIPPVANAGPSRTITLPTDSVILSGSGTADSGSKVVAYLWSQISGPSTANILDQGAASTAATGFIQGSYLFQLMVTDNKGLTGVDTMIVTVNPGQFQTLSLQPANNQNEYSLVLLNGGDESGPALASIETDAWTVGGAPISIRGIVKFDLSSIPSTAKIQSANLYLYSNPTPSTGDQIHANFGTSNSFTIQQVTSSWSTSGLTWFNQPAGATGNQIIIPDTAQAMVDLNVDVTGMVTSMIAGNANYGFLLKLQNEVTYNSRIFVSSRNSAYPAKYPKLVVNYK